jgi:hypothetical protein
MAERLRPEDVESLLRSASMAPLSTEHVQRVREEHRELLAERAELERLLRQLAPSWQEARRLLNELHRILGEV